MTPEKPPVRPVGATAASERPPEPPAAERLTERPESPDPAMAQQERRARWCEAIPDRDGPVDIIDAAMTAADTEQADLKAEVARLREVASNNFNILELAEAEVDRLREEATWAALAAETGAERAQASVERGTEHHEPVFDPFQCATDDDDGPCGCRACVVQAERDEARASIERVKVLAESWRYTGEFGWGPWQAGEGPGPDDAYLDSVAHQILKALDAPTTPEDLQQARADGTLVETFTTSPLTAGDRAPLTMQAIARLAAVRARLDEAGRRMDMPPDDDRPKKRSREWGSEW